MTTLSEPNVQSIYGIIFGVSWPEDPDDAAEEEDVDEDTSENRHGQEPHALVIQIYF